MKFFETKTAISKMLSIVHEVTEEKGIVAIVFMRHHANPGSSKGATKLQSSGRMVLPPGTKNTSIFEFKPFLN